MRVIRDCSFDEERALYGEHDIKLVNVSFSGKADGESALKEASDIECDNVFFNLRYPLWHDRNVVIKNSTMTENCRAALWYTDKVEITESHLNGIKALRECSDVRIKDTDIVSPEFGWRSSSIFADNVKAEGEYFMFESRKLDLRNIDFKGKYSFQYIEDARFENCRFDTKDAFWHSKNTTVINSVIKGEYLAWYSENLTLIDCRIIGTQPLCYARNLKMVNCTMTDTDLSFEKSDVDASIIGDILSIKNPKSGKITVKGKIGSVILDDDRSRAEIIEI